MEPAVNTPSNAVTPRAQTQINLNNSKKPNSKKPIPWAIYGLVALLIVVTVSFAGIYTLTVWTSVPLTGSVASTNGVAISGAQIITEDGTAVSDEFGNFTINALPYGEVSVTASKDGFLDSTQIVDLELRTGAEADITLTEVEFGLVKGSVRVADNLDTDFSQFQVTLGDEVLSLSDNGFFESERIEPGEAVLRVSSPGTSEFSQTITVVSGINQIPEIVLGEEKSIVVEVKDWYTGEVLDNTTVVVDSDSFTTNENGQVIIEGVDGALVNEVRLSRSDYSTKTAVVDSQNGFRFIMPQEGTLYYTSSQDGVSRIYKSNLDGSDSEVVSLSDIHVTGMSVTGEGIFFTAWEVGGLRDSFDNPIEDIYYYDFEDNRQTRIINLRGTNQIPGGLERPIPLLGQQRIATIEQTINNVTIKLRNFDETTDTNVLTLARGSDELVNVTDVIVSPDGNYLAALKQVSKGGESENSIRLISINDDSVNQNIIFSDDDLVIQGMIRFTADSQQIIFETEEKGTQLIQVLEIGGAGTTEIEGLDLDRYSTELLGGDMYYISDNELYRVNLETSATSKVIDGFEVTNFLLYGDQGILLESRGKLWYWDQELQGNPALVQANSNFLFLKN